MRDPLDRLRDSLTRDNIWLYVLSLLSKKQMYAYKLKNEIEKRFKFKPSLITVYFVLYRLETAGYIEKSTKKEKALGPERVYYSITTLGRRELKKARKLLIFSARRI